MAISIPLGSTAAAYIAEVTYPRAKTILKPCHCDLAGIPSVVIGFMGIVLFNPLIARVFST